MGRTKWKQGLRDDRWLAELNEKLKKHGLASKIARDLGINPSTINRLKTGVIESPALVLAVSAKLGISPPTWAKPQGDALADRWMATYRDLRVAGVGQERILQVIEQLDRIVDDLKLIKQKRDEASEAEDKLWSQLSVRPKRPVSN